MLLYNFNMKEIITRIDYTPYKLSDWIDIDKDNIQPIVKKILSNNPRATKYLENNMELIDWNILSVIKMPFIY